MADLVAVARTCGHTTNIDLAGHKPFERDEKLVWAGASKCPRCDPKMKKVDAARHAKQLEEARAAEERMGLDPLRGSAKSIAWGIQVRVDLIARAFVALELDEEAFDVAVCVPAGEVDSASWWIDHRDAEPQDLPQLLGRALGTDAARACENPHA